MSLADTLKELESALLDVTQEMRDTCEVESHPILNAESAPNRFALMSLFFDDIRGVRVEHDLDLDIITVSLFDDESEIELGDESALADWAREFYRDNY